MSQKVFNVIVLLFSVNAFARLEIKEIPLSQTQQVVCRTFHYPTKRMTTDTQVTSVRFSNGVLLMNIGIPDRTSPGGLQELSGRIVRVEQVRGGGNDLIVYEIEPTRNSASGAIFKNASRVYLSIDYFRGILDRFGGRRSTLQIRSKNGNVEEVALPAWMKDSTLACELYPYP